MDLQGRVALITGANHGIGRSTAQLLAEGGAAVLLTYLRTEAPESYPETYRANRRLDGEDVARAIRDSGGRAHAIEADLLDPKTTPMLFDTAERELGGVDILVNNATGHCAHDSFAGVEAVGKNASSPVTAEAFDNTFGVDARATALLIAEFARRHIERGAQWGRVVSLTSGGPMGFPGEITYGAAKAALENYTMAASVELGSYGITANVVYPPVTDTGWVTAEVQEFVDASSDHIHVAEPIDVARVIAWLCSDDAAMVTGNIVRLR
jgi:3-oxoacyl-[acyl-carrier protein] reductase